MSGWARHVRGAVASVPELAFFFLAACAVTWPAVLHVGRALPLGTDTPTIPLFCLWTMWWNVDRFASGLSGWWDAPLFHPTPGTLAFSEPLILQSVMAAPVWWLTDSPVLAYDLVLLVSLALNGFAASRLLRWFHVSPVARIAGGVFVVLTPLVNVMVGVLPLVPLFPTIWTLHAMWRYGRRPSPGRGALVGACFGLVVLACGHYGLFLSVLLLLAGGLVLGRKLLERRAWTGLLVAALAAAAVAGPVLYEQRRAMAAHGFKRDSHRVRALSASPIDYAQTPWDLAVSVPKVSTARRPDHRAFCPGPLKVRLAVAGVVGALASRARRRWALFALVFGWAAWLLSQGVKPRLGGFVPFEALAAVYPGMAQVRNIFRFAVFWQLMVALMAAHGLDVAMRGMAWGLRGARTRLLTRVRAPVVRGAAVLVALLASLELTPARQALYQPPRRDENQGWVGFLAQTPPHAVVAQAPFPKDGEVENAVETAELLWFQMEFRRPVVNGYSSFFPQTYITLFDSMREFPKPASLDHLARHSVTHVVVSRAEASPDLLALVPRLRLVFGDDRARVDVYALLPAP